MARVSFGSRAGGASDYLAHGTSVYRQSNVNGVYASLQDLTDALKREVTDCTQSESPELTTCELSISEEAELPLLRPGIGPYSDNGEHDLSPEYKTVWTDGTEGFPGVTGVLPKATITSILGAPEGQPRQIVQRAASRAIVQALEATDGFKYSFNNAWAAKDEGGLRFSYICQDSMQNKDRHANGFTKTQKHLKTPGEGERGPRKPTYDCKGSVSVKFSYARRRVDVYYRHYAIHSAVADRKAVPRPLPMHRAKGARSSLPAKPYADLAPPEPDTGGLYSALQDQRTGSANAEGAASYPNRSEVYVPSRKRKRPWEVPAPPPNKPLSLLELLQQSEGAKSPTATQKADIRPMSTSALPPPIDYNLPSWQPPAQPPSFPVATPSATGKGSTPYRDWKSAPYPPPYQPQQQTRIGTFAPVAIPKLQPGYQTKATPQAYQGLPSGKQHPKAQGMFSTLKPVRKDEYVGFAPQFVAYSGNRVKSSCYACRMSKRKCDEARPVCTACAHSSKVDCVYDNAPAVSTRAPTYGSNYQAQLPQQQPTPNAMPTMALTQQTTGAAQSVFSTQQSYRTAVSATPAYPMGPVSMQGYATAASSQTFGRLTQSQSVPGGEAKEGSPDPWFPRR
ncbi:hypothetical protein LTR01_007773 [Friedmanniomyces endolithicus]|nr:hypothetical protein LTS00_013610 [Friedmanniomyces endolithicus]KAK0303911.1 hypothetical protein LTR01_007773 [Friedmanniomyces endolithicus]